MCTPILGLFNPPPQTAYRSSRPFFPQYAIATNGQTDGQTERRRNSTCKNSPLKLYVRRGLIMIRCQLIVNASSVHQRPYMTVVLMRNNTSLLWGAFYNRWQRNNWQQNRSALYSSRIERKERDVKTKQNTKISSIIKLSSSSSCGLSSGCFRFHERPPCLSMFCSMIGSCQTNVEWSNIRFNCVEPSLTRSAWSVVPVPG